MASRTTPDGPTWRAATPRDVAAITDLIAACELDVDGMAEIDPGDVQMSFGRIGFDASVDCVLALDGDELVGRAELYRTHAEVDVRPTHRGRGIGTELLRWTERRARETGRTVVDQTVSDANVAAAALLRANAYEATETAWLLQIRFDDGPPPPSGPPPGITLRRFEPGSDEPTAHRVIEDAFDEWPGRTPQTFEEWERLVPAHPAFSPTRSFLAFDGDACVGAALHLDYEGSEEGWVQQLATAATHRHRGIARALLHAAFAAAYEGGKTACGLSTSSKTGALGLYERVGMRVRRSYTRWSKTL